MSFSDVNISNFSFNFDYLLLLSFSDVNISNFSFNFDYLLFDILQRCQFQ